MKKTYHARLLAALYLIIGALPNLTGQSQTPDPGCFTSSVGDSIRPAAAFFNYGSGTKMKNFTSRTRLTIGQPVIGLALGDDYNSYYGFWTSFLVAPLPPMVTATQGDLLDRIQLSWSNNPLGPFPNQGFKIFRDGVFLASVDSKTRNFNDFNVIAGRPYLYEVRGINIYGEGQPGKALGFQVPNGVVTGWVQTPNGRPVPDAMVSLTPLQGFAASFGFDDGAFYSDATTTGFMPASGNPWSITFWIKTDSAGANAGIMQLDDNYLLNIRPLQSSGGQEGIAVDRGAGTLLSAAFPDATKHAWHHIALSFNDGQLRLYIDGTLSAQAPAAGSDFSAKKLNLGARAATGRWRGKLDELRVYHLSLDELSLGSVMEATASSLTPGLKLYWKMDEELGTKSFDVLNRQKLYFCGPVFDKDRPTVRTAGITNEEGFYRIESASYGTGTTFLAKPSKSFYLHRALKFVRDEEDYATLPDFSVPEKATFELWINSAGPDGDQCLLSKLWPGNDFRLLLRENGLSSDIILYFSGQEHNFGQLGMGYQHLAFTMAANGTDRTVVVYKNGIQIGSHTFAGVTGDFGSALAEQWYLGARPSGGGRMDFYDGLVDEVAVYDTTLSETDILYHVQHSRNPQENGLQVYFALDEGSGIRLNNSGSAFLPFGNNYGADWTPFAPNQMTSPHVFTPGTRQVTLNPSVTSVDQVDFTDRSTVPVSGFVRYKGTECFAPNVEILVNGASFSPKVFTDSTGKFVIDFDPGTTATLTPVFENHEFSPVFWEVINLPSPIAGILFTDITTRKVKGQVAGGLCKKSVIKAPPGVGQGTVCAVKVRSADGCLERQIIIDNIEGEYEFEELPPLESLTVAVVEHSDPDVKTAFQVQGGSTIDLTKKDTIIDFTYFAPPEVVILSGLDPKPNCSPEVIVLNKDDSVTVRLGMIEQYYPLLDSLNNVLDDGTCAVDTADFRIINFVGEDVRDTAMSNGVLRYKFKVRNPNPSPPYLKSIQFVGTSLGGRTSSLVKEVLVTGIRNKENTFTTLLPEMPSVVLRDPPGDGSHAFLEENSTVCKTYTAFLDYEVGGGGGLELHLGGNVEVAIGIGVATIQNAGLIFDIGTEFQLSYQKVSDTSFQTCTTISERLSTGDNELIVGSAQGGDILMGEAINIIFGFADKVTFVDSTCSPDLKTVLNVEPGSFGTVFMYSEYYIKDYVMRYLDSLILLANGTPQDSANYVTSKKRWEDILKRNEGLRDKAKLKRNISFDASVTYEYSETADTSYSTSTEELFNSEESLATNIGYEFNKFGFTGSVKFFGSTSKSKKNENGTEKGLTTGYVLADNDPGDAFSVDVAMDSVYKTPVFRTRAGSSSCPWEPGTAHREGNSLTFRDGSAALAVNVPAHEPAVFKFNFGNTSATGETWTYAFTAGPESNPHGAKLSVNGSPMDVPIMYAIPWGTSIPVTVTMERGPEEYEYDSLELVLYSLCEDVRANALGILPDDDTILYSAQYVSAHFIRPCSEVDITVPEQNFVVLNNDPTQPGTIRRITVSGYDLSNSDFQLVRVQYRRSDGDGAWINITGPSGAHERYNPNWSGFAALPNPKPPILGPDYTQYFWETAGLGDGTYEIHAWAVCTGDATDKPGFSEIIKGRIDREPPSLLGVPQPSDGVYHVGDEISFTFNQHINCDKLIAADITQANNVGLYDATTDELIDIDITCFENKIVLDPNFDNKFFENRILRAELHGIEDLTGNESTFFKWEFFVDRNELAWLTDSLGMTKFEDENKTITANIHNRGGYPVPFSIQGIPDWIHVVPNQGTLAPNEIRPVTFRVDSTLAFGYWPDTVVLHTETGLNPFFMGGDEPLPLGVRVVCRPPYAPFNPNVFENSMTMVLNVDIEGTLSADPEDIVAAFIDDQLRGRANVQYVPQVNGYVVYLAVYGDPSDLLKPIRLEVWDASQCQRYGSVVESFTFQPDNVIGSLNNLQTIHTAGLLLREVPLNFGWNWVSFNLAMPDNSLDAALATLLHPENDLIRGQTSFAQYTGGWFGTLNQVNNTSMFIYRADAPDTLRMQGTAIDPATLPIPVVAGWNWVGYVPHYALPLNDALASLPAQVGDVIKSQHAFAEYLNPMDGWVGNLRYMSPPNGYQIRLSQGGTLTYPPPPAPLTETATQARGESEPVPPHWVVNPSKFEHSSTLVGMLRADGVNATTSNMELGAFAGEEVRGTAQAIYVESLDAHLFFLTTYANASGELLRFNLYDDAGGTVRDLSEMLYFVPNQHSGSIQNPVPFEWLTTRTEEDFGATLGFDVQPNPFATETTLRFNLPKAEEVTLTISDAQGREVVRRPISAVAGPNVATWNGRSDTGSWLSSGVYTLRLQAAAGSVVRKVVLQRLP